MKRFYFLFVAAFVIASQVRAQNIFYFPFNPKDTSNLTQFEIKWYSGQLSAMKESVLFNDKSRNEIYRFTWLRTFHHPVAIRIEKYNHSYVLYWKMCDGAGGYAPGKLIVDKHKTITEANWNEFASRLQNLDFWRLSTKERVFGDDGAEWILEGKLFDNYHVVTRWTPNASTGYYKLCDFLIGLTGLKIPAHQKY